MGKDQHKTPTMYYQSSGNPLHNTKRISSQDIQFLMNYEDMKICLMNHPSPVYIGFPYGPYVVFLGNNRKSICY